MCSSDLASMVLGILVGAGLAFFLAYLNDSVKTVDDVKAALTQQGMVVRPSTPEQLGTLIKNDLARWKKVVTDARIAAD